MKWRTVIKKAKVDELRMLQEVLFASDKGLLTARAVKDIKQHDTSDSLRLIEWFGGEVTVTGQSTEVLVLDMECEYEESDRV